MMGQMRALNTIGETEMTAAVTAMIGPLSGYLAGRQRGGSNVCALENLWAERLHVKHAIACNSATSGLMAAAFVIGLKPGDKFLVPALTMSATAAAPMFTGATPIFGDVEELDFALSSKQVEEPEHDAVFLTHLFGLAIDEGWWAGYARQNGMRLVVDASQAPFASADGVYAGTLADIGVYSLNVHKPLQCGEGGICVTNDDHLAELLRAFINHGETVSMRIGLNLRMPEVCAAIALVQLNKGERIVSWRREQAEAIIKAIGDVPGLRLPYVHPDCEHVYYAIPFLVDHKRDEFCAELRRQGVPIVAGYGGGPLYRRPAFAKYARSCPVAEDLEDRRLLYFENCAYDPTPEQITQIGAAFQKAGKVL